MATQPVLDLPPSIPPPQTVEAVLQQNGILVNVPGNPPGEVPIMELHMARSVLIFQTSISTSTDVGATITSDQEMPFIPNLTGTDIHRMQYAYPAQLYFSHSTYWNGCLDYTFWAVKPPMAVGRARVIFRPSLPPGSTVTHDTAQREIMKEWDMSSTNQFQFSIGGYNMRNFRNCAAIAHPNSLAYGGIRIPLNDYKMGYVSTFLTNKYQPGGIFPETANIFVFQSISNPQFRVYQGPFLTREESALTTLFNADLNT